jgi:branched-chain amino acid transport system ATP-binding protein
MVLYDAERPKNTTNGPSVRPEIIASPTCDAEGRSPISSSLQRFGLEFHRQSRQPPVFVTVVTVNARNRERQCRAMGESNQASRSEETALVLDVHDLDVVYGGAIHVLRNVSLQVRSGGVVAILGANGAGKTTLLRAISGLLSYHNGRVAKGDVTFLGRKSTGTDPASLVRSGLAQVMEGRRIFSELTVDDNLRTGAFTRKDKAASAQSYAHVMELFPRLAERRKQVAGYMSGGEQQMLAIGRALMADPKLLLLDEPSLGLAPIIVEQIFEIIAEINKTGTSVLIVEQNAAMALKNSTYAYVMETGRVATEGRASDLLNDPTVQALYLGGESARTSFHELQTYRRKASYRA